MSRKKKCLDARGQASPKQTPTPEAWQGWTGNLAHPHSPSGSGGPGGFYATGPLSDDLGTESGEDSEFVPPHPDAPGPLQGNNIPKTTGGKSNSAPKQVNDDAAVVLLKKKDVFLDVEVKYQIMADEIGLGIGGGVTSFAIPFPEFSPPDKPNKGDPGTMTWNATIEIRTKYESDKMRDLYSCYGRGTTSADREAGDITVGFHESCHRNDYVNHLETNGLPALPNLKPGMSINDFNREQNKFTRAYNKYEPAMKQKSVKDTDEVGFKKSTWKTRGGAGDKCFKHNPKQ